MKAFEKNILVANELSESYPIAIEIPFVDHEQLISVCPREGLLFLDSRATDLTRGRYSFLGILPFEMLIVKQEENQDPFEMLKEKVKAYSLPKIEELPPFQGGAAGMLGYELGHYLEKLPPRRIKDNPFPECLVGLYDLVFAWDHTLQRAWIFSSGFPHREEPHRQIHAQKRLQEALALVDCAKEIKSPCQFNFSLEEIISTFTQTSYEQAVNRVKEYIRAGDIFEANISQCFSTTWLADRDSFDLYRILHNINPAPFSAYFEYKEFAIISASPERFLKLTKGVVETRPIKGTRPRHSDGQIDKQQAEELEQSEKDRAENIMIVDLMRNDLSRVCLPHSVKVKQLCKVESFSSVHHLVSAIEGKLKPALTAVDLIKATFPGGSITGAPKIRAMEIIHEIEPYVRGPYCGSIGYIGFNGDLDLSITIRTLVKSGERLTYQVGGAITIDSDPQEEYRETLVKATVLQRALTGKN